MQHEKSLLKALTGVIKCINGFLMQFFTLKYANIFMLSFRVFCSINNGLEVHCLDISMYRRLDVAKIDHYIAIKLDKLPDYEWTIIKSGNR